MKQETRQHVTAAVAYGCWAAAVVLTWFRVTERLPMQYGTVIVLLIGIAMGAGVKLSRMRLTATMLAAFQAGMFAAEQRAQEREERNA
jgi:CHASE2 domain-containing sensor protein